MTKSFLTFACLFAIICALTSCRPNELRGAGTKSAVAPTVTLFNTIDIDVTLKAVINIQEGARPAVQISGYDNVIKHIKATVENGKLRIYTDLDDSWSIDGKDLSVVITMPAITALSLTGAPDADIHGNITGKEFAIDISGASTIKLDNLNVDDFSIDIAGSGDVEIKGGTVKHAGYEINGAGELKAFGLQTAETEATISGTGTGEVTASQKLTANINGAGTIKYKGHPALSQDVAGAGTISDAN
jgi:hypothetical protein